MFGPILDSMSANDDRNAWKAEYIALLDKATTQEVQLPQAQALKLKNAPPFLYRYRRFNKNSKSELLDDYIWLSHPNEFNDPFDSALLISEEILLKRMFKARPDLLLARPWAASLSDDERQSVRESEQPFNALWTILKAKGILSDAMSSEQAFETFMKECRAADKKTQYIPFSALKNTVRIGCFCENFSSVLMWSHYAESHSGICIEYRTEELFQNPEILVFLHPVIYKPERFDSTKHFDPEGIREPNILSPTLASCHKFPDWSYEKEWRLVMPIRSGNDSQKFAIKARPSRILVGVKAKPHRLKRIRGLAEKIPVAVSVGEMSETDFSLVFE